MDKPMMPAMPDFGELQDKFDELMVEGDYNTGAQMMRDMGDMLIKFADVLETIGNLTNGTSGNREERRSSSRHHR